MPNHVHLILCPRDENGLGRALGRTAGGRISSTGGAAGAVFDGRFASVAMDQDHLIAAIRHVALNPVRARLAARAQDWKWSSVRAHLEGKDDGLVAAKPVLDRVGDFARLIADRDNDSAFAALRAAEQTGRPLGTAEFIEGLERVLGRRIARRAPGRKPAQETGEQPNLL